MYNIKPTKLNVINIFKIAEATKQLPNCKEPNSALPVIGTFLATSKNMFIEKTVNKALQTALIMMQPIRYEKILFRYSACVSVNIAQTKIFKHIFIII